MSATENVEGILSTLSVDGMLCMMRRLGQALDDGSMVRPVDGIGGAAFFDGATFTFNERRDHSQRLAGSGEQEWRVEAGFRRHNHSLTMTAISINFGWMDPTPKPRWSGKIKTASQQESANEPL